MASDVTRLTDCKPSGPEPIEFWDAFTAIPSCAARVLPPTSAMTRLPLLAPDVSWTLIPVPAASSAALRCSRVPWMLVALLIAESTSLSDWAWLRSRVAVTPLRSVSEICPSWVIPWPPRKLRNRTESMPATREFPVSVFPEAAASSPN